MNTSEISKRLGKRIQQLRIEQGIASQEKFGELTGLHRTFVGRIERGESNITLNTMCKIASTLGMTLSDLLARIEDTED